MRDAMLVCLLLLQLIGCDSDAVVIDGGAPDAAVPIDASDASHPECDPALSALEGAPMEAPSFEPDSLRAATCAFRQLGEAVERSRVICSGENSHGAAESSRLHGLLARYLVLEQGVRVIAYEATEAGTAHWDRYIETGDEDALAAGYIDMARSLGDSEESEDLIRFLREVSLELPAGERIRLTGFDIAVQPGETRKSLLAYVETVAPDEVETWRSALASSDFQAVGDNAEALYEQLGAREADYVVASDRASWERARRDVLNLRDGARFLHYYYMNQFGAGNARYREPGMLRNIEDLLARTSESERVMLIAHNDHCSRDMTIGTDTSGVAAPSFGTQLAQSAEWGDRYLVVAQLYASGSFMNAGVSGYAPYTFEAGEGTLESAIGELVSSDALLLDVDTTRIDMSAAYPRNIYMFPQFTPADEHDALLWLREVTPTTLR